MRITDQVVKLFLEYPKGHWLLRISIIQDFPADGKVAKTLRKILWFVCTARNAFVIVLVSFIAFGMDPTASGHKFTMTGEIQGGLPSFKIGVPVVSNIFLSVE